MLLLLAGGMGCGGDPTRAGPTAPASAVRATAPGAEGDTIPDQWIVLFRDSVGEVSTRAQRIARAHGGEVRATFEHAVRGFAAELTPDNVAALRADPAVASVEPDRVVGLADRQAAGSWGIDRIDQPALPLDGLYTYAGGSTGGGAGVDVYVFDTGIYPAHREFGGRASGVYSVVIDANGTYDCHGHGTHVAGTIGGATVGVAKQARLLGVRVLNCSGTGSTSGLVAALDWVLVHATRPAVINMSVSGAASPALNLAVAATVTSGLTVVVAAGNNHANACTKSPAGEASALTVGATSATDAQASFSNFGPCVDLYAPGVSVRSASRAGPTSYATMSGTSMASPHVAGAAALVLGANRSASPAEVARAILDGAVPGVVRAIGVGSPNRLLQTAGLAVPPAVARVTVSAVSGVSAPSWAMPVGAAAQFAAQSFQASGTPLDVRARTVRFASTATKVASVDSLTGAARALAVGTFAVVARVDGVPARSPNVYVTPPATVRVATVRVTRVGSVGTTGALTVGTTASFGVTLYGAGGVRLSPLGRTTRWSTNYPAVAAVDPLTGVVRGLKPGRFIVRATVDGVTGSTGQLTVQPVP